MNYPLGPLHFYIRHPEGELGVRAGESKYNISFIVLTDNDKKNIIYVTLSASKKTDIGATEGWKQASRPMLQSLKGLQANKSNIQLYIKVDVQTSPFRKCQKTI